MAKYKVVNEKPINADFWWRRPMLEENGQVKTDENGNVLVEQLVVRSIEQEKIDKVSSFLEGASYISFNELKNVAMDLKGLKENLSAFKDQAVTKIALDEALDKTVNAIDVYKKDEVYPKTQTYSKSEVYSKFEANSQFVSKEEAAALNSYVKLTDDQDITGQKNFSNIHCDDFTGGAVTCNSLKVNGYTISIGQEELCNIQLK